MARRRPEVGRAVRDVLQHTGPMPPEAAAPFAHYRHAVKESWRMLEYIATTDTTGELPLLNRDTYARALSAGRFGGSPSE